MSEQYFKLKKDREEYYKNEISKYLIDPEKHNFDVYLSEIEITMNERQHDFNYELHSRTTITRNPVLITVFLNDFDLRVLK